MGVRPLAHWRARGVLLTFQIIDSNRTAVEHAAFAVMVGYDDLFDRKIVQQSH
jgi:hypothetical protein